MHLVVHWGVVVVVVFSVLKIASAASTCDVYVDITDGQKDGDNIIKDGIVYTPNDYFDFYNDGTVIRGCICNLRACVRKCCLEGEFLNLTSRTCMAATTTTSNTLYGFSTYNIVNVPENKICDEEEIKIKLDQDFSVVDGVLVWDDLRFAMEDFCLGVTDDNQTLALACITYEDTTFWDRIVTSLGMIISMPFLLLTFLVYLILPDSNMHRKALMFYVMTLFFGYLILTGIQLNENTIPDGFCHTLGYGIIFFFISSFFWMNVMCVDMWLAFSGLRGFQGQRSTERKRFLIYCLYALGTPLILLLIVWLVNTYGDKNSIFYPNLGITRCFLDDGYPNLFYFYLPMAIIITINIVMFILTALKIQRVKKETSMLKHSDNKRHSFEEDKQKFNLYVKLLFAMGINWSMEVISWAVGWTIPSTSTYIWYFTDFANAAYGVFIFLMFVFKRKIWISVKKRYYVWRGRPHLAQALSTSNRTRSTADTTVTTDCRMSDMKNGSRSEERPLNRN